MVVKHDIINFKPTFFDKMHPKVTFVQALNNKYVDQEELENQLILPKDKSISTEITFVGFGKVSTIQKQLKQLTSIDLSSRNIDSVGDLSSLKGVLNRVQVLNLADNKLSWQDVILILSCLPNLREIVLTGNRLTVEDIEFPNQPYKKLTSLTLGRVNLDWTQVVRILSRIWISIDQLDLWDNNLRMQDLKLTAADGINSSFINEVLTLKLSHNYLFTLDWVNDIGPIENLTELDMSHCQLEIIDFDQKALEQLRNLSVLNVSNNNIHSWTSISCLNYLEKLTSLICHENPFYISEKLAKALTVARLAKIKILNREEITKNLRRDSEILYLRKTFLEFQNSKDSKSDEFKRAHPRYDELVEIYGLPEDLNRKQTIEKYITVDLCLDDKQVTKKLPCDMRISNLQMLCKRLFNLKPSSKIQIICCEAEPSGGDISYPLDKGGQTLHFFSVKNGSRLQIKID